MKKETINFNVDATDVFGEVITDKNDKPVKLSHEVVNILNHPHSIPEGKGLEVKDILSRLTIQQKIASKEPQVYTTEELSVIQIAVKTLINNKCIGIGLGGLILKITE